MRQRVRRSCARAQRYHVSNKLRGQLVERGDRTAEISEVGRITRVDVLPSRNSEAIDK